MIVGGLFIVAFVLAIVAMAKGRVGQGTTMLLASIIVPLVLYLGLGATRTAEFAKQVKDAPNAKAAVAAQAAPEDVYKTTSVALFNAYESNEVATDAEINDKVVEISGTVESIDKDAFDHIVVHLSTTNEFMSTSLTMGDSEAAKAGALRKGQAITARCGDIVR